MATPWIIADRYIIENRESDLLGKGGMGAVYRGFDQQQQRTVAIKALKPEIVAEQPELVARFIREGETLRQIDHPNIVKLLTAVVDDATVTDGLQHFLVMEYVAGGSLRLRLDAQKQLPVAEVLKIGLELADALARAHHLQVIHRDLKPDNVLLAEDGTPRLSDFGMAQMVGSPRVTESGMLIGTVHYMSPEACNGEHLDARTDIWGFGVILFEMLAGQRPFTGETLISVLHNILTQTTPDLLALCPTAPPALVSLIYSMLAKDPARRISSARQVAAQLEAISQNHDTRPVILPDHPSGVLKTERANSVLSPTLPSARRDQLLLLRKVKNFWIDGVLEKARQQQGLIQLNREVYESAVDNPWQTVVDTAVSQPDSHRSLLALFEKYDNALLILGDPGAGKTTTMLQLAYELIGRAEFDHSQPIPVILNLASWTEERDTIADWIVKELTNKYQVPRRLGRKWLDNNDLIFLLDGLDEVQPVHQSACVQAINEFRQEHGLSGLVVCCRLTEYERLSMKLKSIGAVRLHPLTPIQIDTYLAGIGERMQRLRQAIQTDSDLQKIAQSPLTLSILTTAFQEGDLIADADILEALTPGNQSQFYRRRLFGTYVQRMFQRRGTGGDFSPAQTERWLNWLAPQLLDHNQPVFLIEQLQPSWLASRRDRWIYLLLTRLADGVVLGLTLGFFLLVARIDPAFAFVRYPPSLYLSSLFAVNPVVLDFLTAVFTNLILGIATAVLTGWQFQRAKRPTPSTVKMIPSGWQEALLTGLLIGGLTILLLLPFGPSPAQVAIFAISEAVYFMLLAFFVHGQSYRTEIRLVEILNWSWVGALQGLLLSIFVLAVLYLTIDAFRSSLLSTLSVTTAFLTLLSGLRRTRMPATYRANHGIYMSARNGILVGLTFFLLFTLAGSRDGLIMGMTTGLQLAMIAGLIFGGASTIKHYTVRYLLWRKDMMPWRYVSFLDFAVGRVLLRRVGGGYIFVHRLLQEFFASNDRASRTVVGD